MLKPVKKIKKPIKKSVKKPVVVAVSGYFNPLHVGHLEMIEKAKKLGDKLIVIINNDKQVNLKKRVPFMNEKDRMRIIAALRDVDKVVLAIDDYQFDKILYNPYERRLSLRSVIFLLKNLMIF